MSDDTHDRERQELLLMEEETKIAGAEYQKATILLRIAKRKSEMKRDEEHVALQDEHIVKCKKEVVRIKALLSGG